MNINDRNTLEERGRGRPLPRRPRGTPRIDCSAAIRRYVRGRRSEVEIDQKIKNLAIAIVEQCYDAGLPDADIRDLAAWVVVSGTERFHGRVCHGTDCHDHPPPGIGGQQGKNNDPVAIYAILLEALSGWLNDCPAIVAVTRRFSDAVDRLLALRPDDEPPADDEVDPDLLAYLLAP